MVRALQNARAGAGGNRQRTSGPHQNRQGQRGRKSGAGYALWNPIYSDIALFRERRTAGSNDRCGQQASNCFEVGELAVPAKGIRAGIVALGAAMALVLLNGCASVPVQADSDPWQYNPNTGYPAVGAGFPWWHDLP